ncbi:MAG: dihydroorotate dehydrogenase electron transfer subunit [Candidatus Omnitrophica bacterium]|nr:dihydroorotate dehydrogenase electron transfer subunit [Candidatus Omnitrophota bacterium]
MKHKIVRALSKKILNDKYVELILENKLESFPEAGQFVHILTTGAFMRRPLSIAGCTEKRIKFIFEIKGPGTKKLSEINEGMHLDIIGPLGNGFPSINREKKIYLAAGGTGIAPLLLAAEKFINEKKNFSLFYGAKTDKDLLISILPHGNYKKFLSTDDGSYGEKGAVLKIFERETVNEKPDIVFAAGPIAMLKKLSELCSKKKIKAYVSLENVMFCGIGVCQGCVIETISGNRRVCKDGPVFDHTEIKWNIPD